MSVNTTIHLGPFLQCQRSFRPGIRSLYSCSQSGCPVFGKAQTSSVRYCSMCGGRLHTTESPINEPTVSTGDLTETISEALLLARQTPALDCWIGNYLPKGNERDTDCHRSREGLLAIDAARIDLELARFEEDFGDECLALRNAYGPERVQLVWGMLRWSC